MSEFISNFLTYTTATVAIGAGALTNLEYNSAVQRSATQIATIDPLLLIHDEIPVESDVPQVTNFLVGPGDIQAAELTSVVFSSTGADTSVGALTTKASGTVTGASVNLRNGPGTNYAIAGRAASGQSLEVTGNSDGVWFEVLDPVQATPVWIHGKFFDAPA